MEETTYLLACVEESRYTVPFIHNLVPKAYTFCSDVLPFVDEGRFKQFARCSRGQFQKILSLIKDDPIFNGALSGKQFAIELQLMITLYRLGSSGEGATIAKISGLFGIGDGGTIQVGFFFIKFWNFYYRGLKLFFRLLPEEFSLPY